MTAYVTAARTHVGHVRRLNEDSILSAPGSGLWAVADGMGGHTQGDWASRTVVDALGNLPDGLEAERTAALVRERMNRTNTTLIQRGQSLSPARTVGSTVVILVLDGRRFACLWAGDSRAYRLRGKAFVQLTRDHTLVQQLADRGLIPASEVPNHPDGHVVTRAIGANPSIELDSVHGDIAEGDIFLLCSDGLSRQVSGQELETTLTQPDLEAAATALLSTALERGAPDNVSFLIIRVAKG